MRRAQRGHGECSPRRHRDNADIVGIWEPVFEPRSHPDVKSRARQPGRRQRQAQAGRPADPERLSHKGDQDGRQYSGHLLEIGHVPSRSGTRRGAVMCGWAGSDGRCGRALRGDASEGHRRLFARRLGHDRAVPPSWRSAAFSAPQRLLDRCSAAFWAPQCLLDRCRSALGDRSASRRQIAFWAPLLFGRFESGFDRNCAELGHPRPEAETSPRRRSHVEAGAA